VTRNSWRCSGRRRSSTTSPEATREISSKSLRSCGGYRFEVEPLPEENPLWEMENVILSPHSTDIVPDINELQTDLFCENLKRYLDEEQLINELNKKLLY
jgi:phosphoglycerate dehydrogenase-like enzyme